MTPLNLPRVLIVDDEQYIRESLARDLRGHFECLLAKDFDSGKALLDQKPSVDIILADESLPTNSGLDLLRICQREHPLVVRCLISGNVDLKKVMAALENSLYHRFFFKPWERDFLIFQMQESLILGKALQESKEDPLTGLLNRRGFEEQILREIEHIQRHKRSFSLALWDLDYFKLVNDSHGHQKGDELLRNLAQLMKKSLRTIDYVARIGGDEFALILPDTHLKEAEIVVKRVLHEQNKNLQAGSSVGLVECQEASESLTELLNRADQLLYKAKNLGRNRVEVQE